MEIPPNFSKLLKFHWNFSLITVSLVKIPQILPSPSRRRPLTANLKPKRMSNLDVKLTKTHFTLNGLTSLGSHNNFNIAILSAAFNSISKAFLATPFLGKKSKRETTRTIISKSKSYHKSDEISSLILEADFTWECLRNVNLHKPCSFILAFSHAHILRPNTSDCAKVFDLQKSKKITKLQGIVQFMLQYNPLSKFSAENQKHSFF